MGLIQDVSGTLQGKRAATLRTKTLVKETGLEKAARWLLGQAQTAGMTALREVVEKGLGFRFDPAPAYLFYVELSGILVALFTQCSGLKVTRKVDTVKEGGVNNVVHKLPGQIEFSNITLKRGLSLSRALWSWFMEGQYDFNVQRINFSIIQGAPGHNLLNIIAGATGLASAGGYAGTEGLSKAQEYIFTLLGKGFGKIKHWDVYDAYPVHWEMSDLNTSSSTVAVIETLEIAHHGLDLSWEALTPMSPAGSIVTTISTAVVSEGIGRSIELIQCVPVSSIERWIVEKDEILLGEEVSFVVEVNEDATETIDYTLIVDGTAQAESTTAGTSAKISHTFEAAGEYTVKVKAANECTIATVESAEVKVTVLCTALADVVIAREGNLVVGEEIRFTAVVNPPNATTPITYTWDFGDDTIVETTSRTVRHTYEDDGTYTVTVKAKNQCSDTAVTDSLSVAVTCEAVSSVTVEGPQGKTGTTAGDENHLETRKEGRFTATVNDSASLPLEYEWDLGDGTKFTMTESSRSVQISHVYTTDGTYTVTVKARALCEGIEWTAAQSGQCKVQAETCNAVASVDSVTANPTALEVGDEVTFTAAISGAGGNPPTAPITYKWTLAYEDGDTEEYETEEPENTLTHVCKKPGKLTATVSAENSCTTTPPENSCDVDVEGVPVSEARVASGPPRLQVGDTGTFRGDAEPPEATDPIFSWDMGDGTTIEGTAADPKETVDHSYSAEGTYMVVVTAKNDYGESGPSEPWEVTVRPST